MNNSLRICRARPNLKLLCLVPFSLKINTTNLLPNCKHFIQECVTRYFLYILHPLQLVLQCMTPIIFRQLKMNSLSMICPFHLQLQKLQSFSQQSLKPRIQLASSVGWQRGECPRKVQNELGVLRAAQMRAHT